MKTNIFEADMISQCVIHLGMGDIIQSEVKKLLQPVLWKIDINIKMLRLQMKTVSVKMK